MKKLLPYYVPRCTMCAYSINIDKQNLPDTEFCKWRKQMILDAQACAECRCHATAETVRLFQLAHNDAKDQYNKKYPKMKDIGDAYRSGELTLDEAKEEARKNVLPYCRVLCAACHHKESINRNKLSK